MPCPWSMRRINLSSACPFKQVGRGETEEVLRMDCHCKILLNDSSSLLFNSTYLSDWKLRGEVTYPNRCTRHVGTKKRTTFMEEQLSTRSLANRSLASSQGEQAGRARQSCYRKPLPAKTPERQKGDPSLDASETQAKRSAKMR